MSIFEAILLGIVEGVTEFIPVSSTGHLTITERLLGFKVDAADITAFTAIIQVGAVAAAIIYFWDDLWGIVRSLFAGLTDAERRSGRDFRYGLAIAVDRSRSRSSASRSATRSRAPCAASGSSGRR